MATPDFVLDLRRRIGHDLLWMPGVTAFVFDADRTRMLAVRRRDNGEWTPVTGIIDPGEEPAQAGAREVAEEAGVLARPARLVDVRALAPITYDNGDIAQFLDLTFVYEHVSGDPHPADGENTAARWFAVDGPPPMNDRFRDLYAIALRDEPTAAFRA